MPRRLLLHAAILGLVSSSGLGGLRAAVEDVIATIEDRAVAHGVSPARLVAVARCESGLDPSATNGRYLGLFQLGHPGELDTFYARGYADPFNPWEAADFAAARFAEGGSGAWSCA